MDHTKTGRDPRQSRSKKKSRSSSSSRSRSRSRPRERGNEEKVNENLEDSWRDEMKERRNKSHSTLNKSAINNTQANWTCNVKWYYRDAKVAFGPPGYYEQLPSICFDNIKIGVRVYPFFEENTSAVGYVLLNKEALMDRVESDDEEIVVGVVLGGTKSRNPLNFRLSDFKKKRIIFRPLEFSPAVWKSGTAVNFSFNVSYHRLRANYMNVFSRGLKVYTFTIKHGIIRLFSSNEDEFDVDDEFFIKEVAVEDKENSNSNNKNTNGKDCVDITDEYVRVSLPIIASLGSVFKMMVIDSKAKDLQINIPIHQLKCLVFYACTGELHMDTDPRLFVALANYLGPNDDLKNKALRAAIADLNLQNVVKYVALYARYRISRAEGLELLARWIKRQRNDSTMSTAIFTSISRYPYVANHVHL